MDIKQRYQRFKEWQLDPFHYKNNQPSTVRCANCGTEFADNYCPRCGQKADVGRVSWNTVRQGITLLWGLESRSLGYTLLQLLLRPGYLISDYISGRRQVSFPPVKMLFILAVAYALFNDLLGHPDSITGESGLDQPLFYWFDNNPGWGMLCLSSFVLFPTWLIFRYAPRHDHHTLPEGFFIQVFMATIILLVAFPSLFSDWFICIVGIYYVVAYKQLFGYGWWGTLWRTSCCLFIGLYSFITVEIIFESCIKGKLSFPKPIYIILAVSICLLIIAHFINKKTENIREHKA